ncbi:exosome complex protein Rrp42 [Candidatus Pacearchaeota archaeon]|nr:exosome complex protein Rrp42 [Candidatus Pacearchaeota archaeon]
MEISNLTKETLIRMFKEGKRFDSRQLTELRDIEVSYNVSNKAEGSARVKIGKTEVVVGVKMAMGEPYPDSPDKGNLTVSADLLPLASPRFEMGPPDFPGIELPRLVDRIIRESHIIQLDKLVIKEGEKVWTVFIDVYPINDDGNLIDAASLGAVAALKNAKIPMLDKDGKIDYDKDSKESIPLTKDISPLSFSFFKIGDSVILDPTREEEEAADARITFGISKWNGQYVINSCQKSGEEPLTQAEIENMMSVITKKFDEVTQKLKKYI